MKLHQEFSRLLCYLSGVHHSDSLKHHYEKFCREIAFPHAHQAPFSLWLADYALKGKFRLRLVDVWTRIFDRNNVIRHKLNLVIALIECDPHFQYLLEHHDSVSHARLKCGKELIVYLGIFILSLFWIGWVYLAISLVDLHGFRKPS